MAGDLDPIDNRLHHTRVRPQQLTHLCGGHVLPLPAKRIAQPVAKEPPAIPVAPQGVAGTEVHVSLLEDVAGHLALGRVIILPVPAE